MIVRPVEWKDFEQIFEIYMQGYDEAERDPGFGDVNRLKKPAKESMPVWAGSLYKDILDGHIIYTVAVDGDKVIGFCYVKKKDIPDSETSHVGSFGIRVLKGMRGRGIGSRLMRDMLKRARGRFDILEITVLSSNSRAKRLYERFGFRLWGVAPNYVKRRKRYTNLDYMYLDL